MRAISSQHMKSISVDLAHNLISFYYLKMATPPVTSQVAKAANAAGSQVAKAANAVNGKAASAANKASQVLANATNAAKQMWSSDKGPLIIVIAITVLLLVFVIIYITFSMKDSNLKGKELTSEVIRLDKVDKPVQIGNTEIPKTAVGREYSYAFWLYIDNFEQIVDATTGQPVQRMVFYRGNTGDITSANPIVMLDGKSNKLHLVIKTQGSALEPAATTDLNKILTKNYFENKALDSEMDGVNKHIVMAVDYVPLQRWVHFVAVVDNKVITLYMDGEIYAVKSVDEFKASRTPEVDRLGKTIDYNLILDKTDGDVFIGKGQVGNKISVAGFMGRFEFYNYAVSMDEVRKSYDKGPISKGVLSFMGINNYGVRSPVYKLDEQS